MTQASATDRKSIRAAEKADELLTTQLTEFITISMNSTLGRRWFYHFLASCGCFHVSPSFDPHRDYFDQGQRNVGMRILAQLQTLCPDQYTDMLKEENVRVSALSARQQFGSSHRGWNAQGSIDDAASFDESGDIIPDLFDSINSTYDP